MNFKFSSSVLFCLIFVSSFCVTKKSDDRELWTGKILNIPEIKSKDKKIVSRFLGDCPSCLETIDPWKQFYAVAKEKNGQIRLVFYVEVIKEDKFNEIKQKLNFADNVIFDQKGSFFKKNLLKFPYPIEDQTFLLNEKNEILLFGNPIVRKELIRKYIENI